MIGIASVWLAAIDAFTFPASAWALLVDTSFSSGFQRSFSASVTALAITSAAALRFLMPGMRLRLKVFL